LITAQTRIRITILGTGDRGILPYLYGARFAPEHPFACCTGCFPASQHRRVGGGCARSAGGETKRPRSQGTAIGTPYGRSNYLTEQRARWELRAQRGNGDARG
jgi:hypothetical protein